MKAKVKKEDRQEEYRRSKKSETKREAEREREIQKRSEGKNQRGIKRMNERENDSTNAGTDQPWGAPPLHAPFTRMQKRKNQRIFLIFLTKY